MKRLANILLLLMLFCMSGCLTKIYLGEPKIREQTNYLTDDSPILGAINPTTIPAGGTWGTVRGIINTNFSNINGTLDSIEVITTEHDAVIDSLRAETLEIIDTLIDHRTELDGKLSISDTANMLAPYAMSSEIVAGAINLSTVQDEIADSLDALRPLFVKTTDTAAMLNPYAKLSDLSEGGIGISVVRDEIADSLNALRANIVVGDGTKGPFFDGSADGGQTLTFYGDNGFWTALQGGAPVANRSYRLPIAALPGAGTTSLMNIDEYGNMGFAFNGLPSTLTATELGYSDGVTSSIQNQLNAKVNASDTAAMLAHYALLSEIGTGGDISTLEMRVDSIVDVLKDSVNVETLLQVDFSIDTLATKAYARSVGGGSVTGITLNSGTLILTGDAGTADDITFYTNGDGQYDLPAGGGNLTIQSQVQAWIADSLDVLRTADSDTIPLFVFGLGSGHSSDTAIFNNGRLAGAFYNSGSDTLYVTELRGVLVEGTGTETIAVQVSWDVNMKDATPTNLNTTALTVTSMTSGTVDTAFDNNGIPPGVWVWGSISGASANNKPTALSLTMTGYRRNRSY